MIQAGWQGTCWLLHKDQRVQEIALCCSKGCLKLCLGDRILASFPCHFWSLEITLTLKLCPPYAASCAWLFHHWNWPGSSVPISKRLPRRKGLAPKLPSALSIACLPPPFVVANATNPFGTPTAPWLHSPGAFGIFSPGRVLTGYVVFKALFRFQVLISDFDATFQTDSAGIYVGLVVAFCLPSPKKRRWKAAGI